MKKLKNIKPDLYEIWLEMEEKNRKNKKRKEKSKKNKKSLSARRLSAEQELWFQFAEPFVSDEWPAEVINAQKIVEPLWIEAQHKDNNERTYFVRPKNFETFTKIMKERDRLMSLNNRIKNLLLKNKYFSHIFCVKWDTKTVAVQDNRLTYSVRPDGKPNFRIFKLERDGKVVFENNNNIYLFVQTDRYRYFTCLTGEFANKYGRDKIIEYIEKNCKTKIDPKSK